MSDPVHEFQVLCESIGKELAFLKRPLRALFIEDSEEMRLIFQERVKPYNVIVDYAVCGETGEHQAIRGGYDLLFIDLVLPGQDGVEIFRKVRDANYAAGQKRPRVIFFTGFVEDAAVERASEIGFAAWVKKPRGLVSREFFDDLMEIFGVKTKAELGLTTEAQTGLLPA